jgi:hypothetical protein
MLKDLTPAQSELAEYMSSLSEEAYCAGWMQGLEYALWQALVDGRSTYGRLALSPTHVDGLRRLSELCGGWIVFDDVAEETFVLRSEWEARFSEWRRTPDAQRIDG